MNKVMATRKRDNPEGGGNRLCLSCRRQCKQPEAAVIAQCPRYYPGPRIKRCTWKQLDLDLLSDRG